MISVIIPVFNTPEPLLRACVDSVLGQSFADKEVIIVDDGSDEPTRRVVESYADGERVRVVRQANAGVSAARNAGLNEARGEYVCYVDADDVLHNEALAILAAVQKQSGADIVIAEDREGHRPRFGRVKGRWHVESYLEIVRTMLYQHKYRPVPWNKLYRKETVCRVPFTEGIVYEDLDWFYRVAEEASKIAVTDDVLYFYRQSAGSILHTWNEHRFDVLEVTERLEKYMQEHHPELVAAATDRRLSAAFNMFLLATAHGYPEKADECWEIIKNYRRRSLFDPEVRLKNKAGIILSYMGRRVIELFA